MTFKCTTCGARCGLRVKCTTGGVRYDPKSRNTYLSNNQDQNEGEEGSQHTLRLLQGSTASQEAHDGDHRRYHHKEVDDVRVALYVYGHGRQDRVPQVDPECCGQQQQAEQL